MSQLLQLFARRDPVAAGTSYTFDGINMSLSVPAWEPTGWPWEIAMDVLPLTVDGSSKTLWMSGANTNRRGRILVSSNRYNFRYRDITETLAQINAGVAIVGVGTTFVSRAENPAGSTVIGGGETSLHPTIPKAVGDTPIDRFGASSAGGGEAFHGIIKNIYMTDGNTPSNSRHYPFADGTGATVVDVLGGQDGTINNFNEANWGVQEGLSIIDGVGAPDGFTGGIPYDGTILAVDTLSAIDHYHQGLPYTAAGRLAASLDQVVTVVSSSAPFDAAGRLCFGIGGVDHYSAGITYTAGGNIAATDLT